MKEIKAPQVIDSAGFKIFLSGSIEMGMAENWQDRLKAELKDFPVVLLNPRRDDWDSSWEQSIDNEKFKEQVEWELMAMEQANLIAVYFAPGTKSPISLLEFGFWAGKNPKKLIVCCPRGFWRKGNIDVVCAFYEIEICDYWENFILSIKYRLEDEI